MTKKVRALFRKGDEEAYYEVRAKFNKETDPLARAAQFIYLNRHGYNGLCRYNSSGGYNVPCGRYAAVHSPTEEMAEASRYLASKSVKLYHGDFLKFMDRAQEGDVVYCDPPYVPLGTSSSFTAYAGNGFGIKQQKALALKAEELHGRGIRVVISNHDTPLSRELYKNADRKKELEVHRSISQKAGSRGRVKELLAIYGG